MTANGAVLVLPGGKPRSEARSRPWQLANLRVALLARSLRRRLGAGVEVRRVRYRVRGWNAGASEATGKGTGASEATGKGTGATGGAGRLDAVRDAGAALDDLLTRYRPEDIVVVGHSMGGRVAVHLAADGRVGAVVALAPWWPDHDADRLPARCRLLTMHGTADTWTDPAAAEAQTVAAQRRGLDARWIAFDGAGHFLIRDYARWHRLTADFVHACLSRRPAA